LNSFNTKKLFTDFPKLYSELDGFECGDEWFDIIYQLSAKLCELANRGDYKPDEMNFEQHPFPKATQVKVKFNSLRFYGYGFSNEMNNLIDAELEQNSSLSQ